MKRDREVRSIALGLLLLSFHRADQPSGVGWLTAPLLDDNAGAAYGSWLRVGVRFDIRWSAWIFLVG